MKSKEKTGNKKRSGIIIVIIVCAVIVLSILLINPVRSLMAMASMNPLPSQEVITDVFAINNSYVNIYLIKSGDKYIAFDAGADPKVTAKALGDLGISASDVIALFLTHTDFDHVAGLPVFSSADLYMSQSNRIYNETDSGRSRSKGFVDMGLDFKEITDGETITVAGKQIQCVYSPGHTDGSVCYIVNGEYLFTGDTMRLDKGKAILFHAVFNTDDEAQKQSISKLAKLDGIKAVFTMHTNYTTDFATAFSNW